MIYHPYEYPNEATNFLEFITPDHVYLSMSLLTILLVISNAHVMLKTAKEKNKHDQKEREVSQVMLLRQKVYMTFWGMFTCIQSDLRDMGNLNIKEFMEIDHAYDISFEKACLMAPPETLDAIMVADKVIRKSFKEIKTFRKGLENVILKEASFKDGDPRKKEFNIGISTNLDRLQQKINETFSNFEALDVELIGCLKKDLNLPFNKEKYQALKEKYQKPLSINLEKKT